MQKNIWKKSSQDAEVITKKMIGEIVLTRYNTIKNMNAQCPKGKETPLPPIVRLKSQGFLNALKR